jgi:hypothetical protein
MLMGDQNKKWLNDKLTEICYSLATFFNYLAIPRKNFFIVSDQDNLANVKPVITYEHINYLINEIYPCNTFNDTIMANIVLEPLVEKKTDNTVVPEKFRQKIKDTIRKFIDINPIQRVDDQILKNSLNYQEMDRSSIKIKEEVITKIYLYYLACKTMYSIVDLKDIYKQVLSKRTTINFGLNSDAENTALQSMIFIITALVDSLDIKTVGKNEVITAFNIIVPNDLTDIYKLEPKNDETLRILLLDIFNSKNLLIDNEGIQYLTDYIALADSLKDKVYASGINNHDNPNTRVFNRMMGFSSYI